MSSLQFELLPGTYAIARLDPNEALPTWSDGPGFLSLSRSESELSIVCLADRVPEDVRRESGFRTFRVKGPLEFSLVGILAEITKVLAERGLSLFAVSTFDTDYVLVREDDLLRAIAALEARGHRFNFPADSVRRPAGDETSRAHRASP